MLLSLILCSRNDSYMGNSKWRLETTLNISIQNAFQTGWIDEIEIIVSDWGSEVPLRKVLSLIPKAEKKVKFLEVPSDIAKIEQKDSKFPEVLALNAAARRSKGKYIGRIDNDTVIGKDFFIKFREMLEGDNHKLAENSFLFAERKMVPFRISKLSWSLNNISNYLKQFSNYLKVETARDYGLKFWGSPVGIMLLSRKIWFNTRGYDQKLLYWGWMEADMALRVSQKHELIDLSKYVSHCFYHLDHYPSLTAYKDRNGPATPRKKNPTIYDNLNYKENDENWGLINYPLSISEYVISSVESYRDPHTHTINDKILYIPQLVTAIILRKIDNLRISWRDDLNSLLNKTRIRLGKYKREIMIRIIQ